MIGDRRYGGGGFTPKDGFHTEFNNCTEAKTKESRREEEEEEFMMRKGYSHRKTNIFLED